MQANDLQVERAKSANLEFMLFHGRWEVYLWTGRRTDLAILEDEERFDVTGIAKFAIALALLR